MIASVKIDQTALSMTANTDKTKLLVNSSDRVLRLFKVSGTQITLLNQFQDVVSHARWHQAFFINLHPLTRIINENNT